MPLVSGFVAESLRSGGSPSVAGIDGRGRFGALAFRSPRQTIQVSDIVEVSRLESGSEKGWQNHRVVGSKMREVVEGGRRDGGDTMVEMVNRLTIRH